MYEAIPVSTSKRRDLKPGTVFDYDDGTPRIPMYVEPLHPDTPHIFGLIENASRSNPIEGDPNYGWDAPVTVLWEPTDGPEQGVSAANVAAMKPANPKQAYGDKKLATATVPPALMLGAAKAFGEGAAKYGAFNWRVSSVEAMTYVGAILRHLSAYVDGEDVDPESSTGKLHLEGIAACVGILLDCTYGGFLIDNRPPKGPAPAMVLTPKEKK